MRIFYAVLLTIFVHSILHAQVVEYPISSNPILKQHTQREAAIRQERIRKYRTDFNYYNNRGLKTSGVTLVEDAACVFAGDTATICVDTATISRFQSLTNLNCNILAGGTVSLDTLCLTYAANTIISSLVIDTICLELCDTANVCDTLIYPIIASRLPDTIIAPLTVMPAESEMTICVDTTNLPGNFFSSFIQDNNLTLGITADLGSCILYESQRFAGIDTVYYEVCDQYCVCDIYQVPVQTTQDTLAIPFFDDFSIAGPYPSSEKWLDKNVFVNNTLANNPPSIGVATFDGLDSNGSPFGGPAGSADILTSAYLNLDGLTAMTLSFYIQPKGLGLPNSPSDSLVLQFKDDFEVWNSIQNFAPFDNQAIPADSIPPDFGTVQAIPIPTEYRYNGFQFRFVSYNSRRGSIEGIWHLDYVRIDLNNSPANQNDLALTTVPNDILRNYSSMPWWQFTGNEDSELYTTIRAGARNHFDETKNIVDSRVNLTAVNAGGTFSNFTIFDATNFSTGESKNIARDIPNVSRSNYISTMQSISMGSDDLLFNTEYVIEVTDQETNPQLSNVFSNDTVRTQTVFSDYFAYDDGTAERGLGLRPAGAQAAVKYSANHGDTIRAIQIHFPHISNNVSNQLFNLRIWVGTLDSDPVYEAVLLRPIYIDDFFVDSLNAFTTYRLNDEAGEFPLPIAIPAGDFYVGWQQSSNTTQPIPIGLDKNTPEADENNFIKLSSVGNWDRLPPGFEGALMIRPVMGSGMPVSTESALSTNDILLSEVMDIFPNPAYNFLNINLKQGKKEDYQIILYNNIGQKMIKTNLQDQIELTNYQNGIYFLKIINLNSKKEFIHKFIILK